MTKEMKKRILFFAEHAGYSVPPGRMICAKQLAEAEALGEELELEVKWEHEEGCWLNYVGDFVSEKTAQRNFESGKWEVLYAYVEDSEGNHLAGLGGIVIDVHREKNYMRVVDAELLLEAISILKKGETA